MHNRYGFALPLLALLVAGVGTVAISTGFPFLGEERAAHRRDVRERTALHASGRALAAVYIEPESLTVTAIDGRMADEFNWPTQVACGYVTVLPSGRVVVPPSMARALIPTARFDHRIRRMVIWGKGWVGAIYSCDVLSHVVRRLPDGRIIYRLAQGGPNVTARRKSISRR